MTAATALVNLLVLMRDQGCSHEQRRSVADSLAQFSLSQGVTVTPIALVPEVRRVKAQTESGLTIDIHYPPAIVPQPFRR